MKLKWNESRFDSKLGRARGLGAAGSSAVHHWVHQRVTAVANLILVLWLVAFVLSVTSLGGDHMAVQAALSSGLNPIFALLFVVSVFYHAKLGLQVVIEDYLHHEGIKVAALLAMKLILGFMAVTCLFSILKVTL